MKKSLFLSFCLVVLMGAIACQQQEQDLLVRTVLVNESFSQPPGEDWTWIRENPDAYKFEDGLKIQVEPGGLMGAGKDAKNIFVRSLPEEARSVAVKVEADHQAQYEQGGLILYNDDDNYVKLVVEHVDGENWVVLVMEISEAAQVINKVPEPEGITNIAMDFTTQGVDCYCWGTEGEITKVGTAAFPMDPRPRIGVFTQSGQPDAERWVTFSDYMIYSEPLEEAKGDEDDS